jgi:hypothetical protein
LPTGQGFQEDSRKETTEDLHGCPRPILPVPFSHLQDTQEWVQHHLHCDALAEAAAILLQQVEQVASICILLHHHHAVTLLQAGNNHSGAAGAAEGLHHTTKSKSMFAGSAGQLLARNAARHNQALYTGTARVLLTDTAKSSAMRPSAAETSTKSSTPQPGIEHKKCKDTTHSHCKEHVPRSSPGRLRRAL